jgi:hypothetical protein
MSQRHSGYPRQPDERYVAPSWVVEQLRPWLRSRCVERVLDTDYRDAAMGRHLAALSFDVVANDHDFLARTAASCSGIDGIIFNPPYGEDRGGRLACKFIRHALDLRVRVVAALLKIDFDSGVTRTDLFRDCSAFAGKLVLLDRIVWFERPGANPSENHCWLLWDWTHRGRPQIFYPSSAAPVAKAGL